LIDITYFGDPIRDSPFTARAWDPAGVIVSNIIPGIICMESFFNSQSGLILTNCDNNNNNLTASPEYIFLEFMILDLYD